MIFFSSKDSFVIAIVSSNNVIVVIMGQRPLKSQLTVILCNYCDHDFHKPNIVDEYEL